MTVAPRPAPVLVASERGADAAYVRDALANEFTRAEVSTHGELAVADFERVRPDVVVLALDSIDKSQQYCVGLMRFSKVAQAHPHRYGILCAPVDLGGLDSAVRARELLGGQIDAYARILRRYAATYRDRGGARCCRSLAARRQQLDWRDGGRTDGGRARSDGRRERPR
jgi:hypothetical protein